MRRPGNPFRAVGVRSAILVVFAAGVAIAAALGLRGHSNASDRRPAPALPTAVLTPPRVTIHGLRGEPAAINFWASWCAPCRAEAPALERAARSVRGQARVVGVDWSDGSGAARSYISRYGWTFPVLRDASGAVGRSYRVSGIPNTFIVDSHGRIADVLQGPQSAGSLRRALGAAGAG